MATLAILIPCYVIVLGLVDLLRFTNPVERYLAYRKLRGMSTLHDWVDCIGGYPFEVVRPDEVIQFYCRRGFDLKGLVTCGNKTGCNQFVFRKL